jgi:hypothetical protein
MQENEDKKIALIYTSLQSLKVGRSFSLSCCKVKILLLNLFEDHSCLEDNIMYKESSTIVAKQLSFKFLLTIFQPFKKENSKKI